MGTILASCDHCGDVELTVPDVRIRARFDASSNEYVFRCPACDRVVVKSATPRLVDLLVAAGVEIDIDVTEPPVPTRPRDRRARRRRARIRRRN